MIVSYCSGKPITFPNLCVDDFGNEWSVTPEMPTPSKYFNQVTVPINTFLHLLEMDRNVSAEAECTHSAI